MDATLTTIHGIDKALQTSLPTPPIWKLVVETTTGASKGDVEADVIFKYPSFKGSNQPLVVFKVHTIYNPSLLQKLIGDSKSGFHPPYQFTLVRGNDPYFDKKKHTDAKNSWGKGDWIWSPKFSCNQLDTKTSAFRTVSLRVDSLITQKVKKKKTKLIAIDRVATTMASQEAMIELKELLRLQFVKLLVEKVDTYEKFLYYCGLCQLQFLDKQRKRVEAQMVDTYQSWTLAFPDRS